MYDVIIVGGGPAGLSAALMLGRCRRKVLLFDGNQYRNAASRGVHGFLSRDGILPGELLQCARADLVKYDTVEIINREVLDANPIGDRGFEVKVTDGLSYQCKKLLLATGVVDVWPDIPGVDQFFGKGVFHCPYCDGWENRDSPIAVYGKGSRGHGVAVELTVWTDSITLCTDGPGDLNDRERADLDRHGIGLREAKVKRLNGNGDGLKIMEFEDEAPLEISGLFFSLGQKQRSHLPEKLGCEFTEKGAVKTGKYESTCVRGLYVAGDASEEVQFVVVAAAEGAQAAFAINTALLKEDLRHRKE